MDELKGKSIIQSLRRKWILYRVLSDVLVSVGISFLVNALAHTFLGWPLSWGIIYFLVMCTGLLLIRPIWKINENIIANWLNEKHPQLEESTGLLLQSPLSLNLLERLQYQKTILALEAVPRPLNISKQIFLPVIISVLLVGAGLIVSNFLKWNRKDLDVKNRVTIIAPKKPEIKLPQMESVHVSIHPPAYTGRAVREQQLFNLVAEEGSTIRWVLKTSQPAKEVKFIFNDRVSIPLVPGASHTEWQVQKQTDSTGFYQLSIDGKISELYKAEMMKDLAPVIVLASPKQYTTIDYGELQQVKLSAGITDDYGIKDAFITATIASGSGEAVKFKEQKISLAGFAPGKTQYQLQQVLSLPALNMQPGDELYFYLQATDNHRQQTRSDVYIVNLPDTAQLMSMDGLGNSLTLKPEYFRSQRQIIIETEQLLKDKDTISEESFKNRSNNLGIDQKLLRLRYGKFLGDEAEAGETNIDDVAGIADFSNAAKITDVFTDKHDNAEDASFYEPETKKQLKATLTEMWNAEKQLRTFMLQGALPFEYKALRLLKDLQQKSRAYVAKTNFKTTPLDPAKRLTGDLSKIELPVLQKDIQQQEDKVAIARRTLAVLEKMKTTGAGTDEQEILRQGNLYLLGQAAQQPGVYLAAATAMKKIVAANQAGMTIAANDITTAEAGIQYSLSAPGHLPAATSGSKKELSRQYFNNLQKKQP